MAFLHPIVAQVYTALGISILAIALYGCTSPRLQEAAWCHQPEDGPHINYFCKVDGKLWRGARPATPDTVSWLIRNGIHTIINLEVLGDDRQQIEAAQPGLSTDAPGAELYYIRLKNSEIYPKYFPTVQDEH